jgi:hypothetical protein
VEKENSGFAGSGVISSHPQAKDRLKRRNNMDPKLEAGIQKEVDAALERVREDRDRREREEIESCDECRANNC